MTHLYTVGHDPCAGRRTVPARFLDTDESPTCRPDGGCPVTSVGVDPDHDYPQPVKLPGRKSATVETTEPDDVDEVAAESGPATGKGRPTPKRRDSTPVRGPVTAPKTRKEALARQRQKDREAKEAGKATSTMNPAQRRAALRSGQILSARDQGETKALARDWVDSRRMFSNYLLWLFPIMIASYLLPWAQLVILVLFFAFISEWLITGRRIRALAIERFGSADGSNLSIGFYAGSRAYLPRRWRMPSPRVDRGDEI